MRVPSAMFGYSDDYMWASQRDPWKADQILSPCMGVAFTHRPLCSAWPAHCASLVWVCVGGLDVVRAGLKMLQVDPVA
jgi:hypothetical protein